MNDLPTEHMFTLEAMRSAIVDAERAHQAALAEREMCIEGRNQWRRSHQLARRAMWIHIAGCVLAGVSLAITWAWQLGWRLW